MINILISLLIGTITNVYGQIGIIIARDGGIIKVYKDSPADLAGLKKGDIILEADNIKGHEYVDGQANTIVKIKLKRKGKIYRYYIPRIDHRKINKR